MEETYVYLWLIHVDVWQKPTQYCKAIILQLKISKFNYIKYKSVPHEVKFGNRHMQGRRRQWQPTPVLLPGKSHGQRSLVGCSPWGCEESDMTERLPFHFSLSCTGEGNGNPLQCSCLENPRDGGAWWAAVYGVTQSRTQLSDFTFTFHFHALEKEMATHSSVLAWRI